MSLNMSMICRICDAAPLIEDIVSWASKLSLPILPSDGSCFFKLSCRKAIRHPDRYQGQIWWFPVINKTSKCYALKCGKVCRPFVSHIIYMAFQLNVPIFVLMRFCIEIKNTMVEKHYNRITKYWLLCLCEHDRDTKQLNLIFHLKGQTALQFKYTWHTMILLIVFQYLYTIHCPTPSGHVTLSSISH